MRKEIGHFLSEGFCIKINSVGSSRIWIDFIFSLMKQSK